MEGLDTILKYFPGLGSCQIEAFRRLGTLYPEWNAKINVISRKDIENLYPNHILHSLAIAAMLGNLQDDTEIMDLGTGGGFPGIPLAIAYPNCRFHLVDRIGKKIRVASEIASELNLSNVTFQHGDAGECHKRFDYVVSRAVMTLDSLSKIAIRNIDKHSPRANRYKPGLICLKGGDLAQEIENTPYPVMEIPVTDFFNLPVYETKKIVYVPMA